jgi:acyl-CoA synthetase (NDP forming)
VVDARVEMCEIKPAPQAFYTNRDLTVFNRPKCALVVLASAKAGSVGMMLLENVMKSVGNVYVMLPTGKGRDHLKELGARVVDDVPDGCDLLVYAGIPTDAPAMVAKFRAHGGKGAVIISSDFAETGNVELERRLQESAGDMPYLGPNGIGVYSEALNTFFVDRIVTDYPLTGGSTALFSQSGGLCIESFCEYLSMHDVPVDEIFSLGNGSGISFTELLASVADNLSVNLVVLHLEGGLRDGEGLHFINALKKATSVKPVIVLPAGLSTKGQKSAASHTGRMTGGADALLAALKQGGAQIAKSEEELRLAICMLNKMPRASEKAVIFTIGGGKGILSADAAERVGLEIRDKLPQEFSEKVKSSLPRFADCTQNPFDFTGSVTLNGLLTVLENSKMLDSPGIFHMIHQVPGATTLKKDGKLVQLTPVEAVGRIAKAIRDNDLSFVLNICAQSRLARDIEREADSYGIMATRVSNSDLALGALKLTIDIWRRYPGIEFRSQGKSSCIPTTDFDSLAAARL